MNHSASPTTCLPPQSHGMIGVARVDITPPGDIYHRMWGAAAHDRAEGIHRPLTATALYLTPGSKTAQAPQANDAERVIIALDHCLLFRRELDAVEAVVAERSGVDASRLLFSFSHTHAAGLMSWNRESLPGGERIRPYLKQMAEQIGDAVRLAQESAEPASLVFGLGHCSLAAHRDYWDEETQQYVCGYNPEGFADDSVVVARATAENGRHIATLVNYACHPTTLAWDNRLVSPDFPGALRETVEEAVGGICVFLQGASGDLGPKVGFVGDVAVADRNGRQLAYAVLETLAGLPPAAQQFVYTGPVVSGATIGTWRYQPFTRYQQMQAAIWSCRDWTLSLPCRSDLPDVAELNSQRQKWVAAQEAAQGAGDAAQAADCRALIERLDRMLNRIEVLDGRRVFEFPMQLLRMGAAFLLAVPGEPYQQLQVELRRRWGWPILVLGLTGGWGPSYLPPREVYGQGIYQESIALLAPGALEAVIDSAAEAIESAWKAESSSSD